jgi:hypothetical protein
MTARFKKRRSIFQETLFLAFAVLNKSKLSHQAIRIEPCEALFSVLDTTQYTRCDIHNYTRRHAYARMIARICAAYVGCIVETAT